MEEVGGEVACGGARREIPSIVISAPHLAQIHAASRSRWVIMHDHTQYRVYPFVSAPRRTIYRPRINSRIYLPSICIRHDASQHASSGGSVVRLLNPATCTTSSASNPPRTAIRSGDWTLGHTRSDRHPSAIPDKVPVAEVGVPMRPEALLGLHPVSRSGGDPSRGFDETYRLNISQKAWMCPLWKQEVSAIAITLDDQEGM